MNANYIVKYEREIHSIAHTTLIKQSRMHFVFNEPGQDIFYNNYNKIQYELSKQIKGCQITYVYKVRLSLSTYS